jgi:hypothetical protein
MGLWEYVHLEECCHDLLHHTLPRVECTAMDPFDGLLGVRGKRAVLCPDKVQLQR